MKEKSTKRGLRAEVWAILAGVGAFLVVLVSMPKPEPAVEQPTAALETPAVTEDGAPPAMVEEVPGAQNSTAMLAQARAAESPQDLAYRRRVAETVERVYADAKVPRALSDTNSSQTIAATNVSQVAAPAGLRGYVETERARRALVDELRGMRRAALVEANRAATNTSPGNPNPTNTPIPK